MEANDVEIYNVLPIFKEGSPNAGRPKKKKKKKNRTHELIYYFYKNKAK